MKVNCDFLPNEYKSFLLNTKALMLSGIFFAGTVAICIVSLTATGQERAGLEQDKNRITSELATLVDQLRSITYDQATIQELITKFEFIQRAMGAVDYPYLRFYHSIEKALPQSPDTQLKRVSIKKLDKISGEQYLITGQAVARPDVTDFEKNLLLSESDGGRRKNFRDVRVRNVTAEPGGESWKFELEFTFLP